MTRKRFRRGSTVSGWMAAALVALVVHGTHAADATPAPTYRVPTGFITDWLVCGPFPNPLAPGGANAAAQRRTGLDTDHLADRGGEAKIEPVVGMTHRTPDGETVAWAALASPNALVDFKAEFEPSEYVVAYAACRLESDVDQDIVLSVGSDDGVKIWIDDRLVHTNHTVRAAVPDQDTVVVRLAQGVHRCLVKVEQGRGDWGFCLRAQSLAGAAAVARLNFESQARLMTSPTLGYPGDLISVSVLDPERARLYDIAHPVKYAAADLAGDRVAALSARTNAPAVFHTRTWRQGGYHITAEIERPGTGTIRLARYVYLGDFDQAVDRFVREAGVRQDRRSRPAMTLAYCVGRLEALRQGGRRALHDASDEIIEYLGWLQEFRTRQGSDDVFRDRCGSHVRAYWSDVDDSPQYYALYVPTTYDRGDPIPLVVSLHGYDASFRPYESYNRQLRPQMRRLAEQFGCAILKPFGRGNTFYRGIGRADVLRTIEEVCRDYDVDRNRIYLMGYSMGGSGTWALGTFFADRFAAIAPIFGGPPYPLPLDPDPDASLRRRITSIPGSPFDCAENLVHTPVFINHGDNDQLVTVEYSRQMARVLQRLGYDVRYWEHPGKGHGGLPIESTLFEWFRRYERPTAPSQVRLKTQSLRHGRMDWIAVERFEHLRAPASVDARVAGENLVAIESSNVSVMTLSPPGRLVDAERRLEVVWNGREADVERIGDRQWRLVSPGTPRRVLTAPLRKTALLEGPMNAVWTSPFLIVQGTQGASERIRALVAAEARSLAERWREAHHVTPRVKHDADVTTGDLQTYHLIVVGGPDENFIARQILAELPVRVSSGAIAFFGETFTGDDLGLAMVHPNPLVPNRYVVFLLATSPDGLFNLAARCDWQFDYFVADGRTLTSNGRSETAVLAGHFDQEWQYRPQYAKNGNRDARDSVRVVHRAPAVAGVVNAPDKLDLSDLVPVLQNGAFRDMALDRTTFGEPLQYGPTGRFKRISASRKGIASRVGHGRNIVAYDLAGQYQKFRAVVGLARPAGSELTAAERENTQVIFSVAGDGEILWQSTRVGWESAPVEVDVDIANVKTLALGVHNAVTWHYRADSANWYDARVER